MKVASSRRIKFRKEFKRICEKVLTIVKECSSIIRVDRDTEAKHYLKKKKFERISNRG